MRCSEFCGDAVGEPGGGSTAGSSGARWRGADEQCPPVFGRIVEPAAYDRRWRKGETPSYVRTHCARISEVVERAHVVTIAGRTPNPMRLRFSI